MEGGFSLTTSPGATHPGPWPPSAGPPPPPARVIGLFRSLREAVSRLGPRIPPITSGCPRNPPNASGCPWSPPIASGCPRSPPITPGCARGIGISRSWMGGGGCPNTPVCPWITSIGLIPPDCARGTGAGGCGWVWRSCGKALNFSLFKRGSLSSDRQWDRVVNPLGVYDYQPSSLTWSKCRSWAPKVPEPATFCSGSHALWWNCVLINGLPSFS